MARMTPETHDEILATAARRFAFAGFKGTSLQDIARDVGCSKAAVLYHFPDKEAILTELMAPALAVLQALDEPHRCRDRSGRRAAGRHGGLRRPRGPVPTGDRAAAGRVPGVARNTRVRAHPRDRVLDAVAGHPERPAARLAARVVLAGIAETSGDFIDVPDGELREALLALLRRALEPAD